MKFTLFLLITFLSTFPSILEACTVCFGGTNSNLQRGFYWGILLLLLLPLGIFSTVAIKIYISCRQKNQSIGLEQPHAH